MGLKTTLKHFKTEPWPILRALDETDRSYATVHVCNLTVPSTNHLSQCQHTFVYH